MLTVEKQQMNQFEAEQSSVFSEPIKLIPNPESPTTSSCCKEHIKTQFHLPENPQGN